MQAGNPHDGNLSYMRANTIMGIFVDYLELPAERFIPVGGGTTILSWRNAVEEFYEDGRMKYESGRPNRVVAIIAVGTPKHTELINVGLVG